MRSFYFSVLFLSSLLIQPVHASLFSVSTNKVNVDQTEISVNVSDISALLELYDLDVAGELNFNYLSGNILFSDAWDAVPLVSDTFRVNQDVDSLQLQPDNSNVLTINAAFKQGSFKTLAENDQLFSFVVNNPLLRDGDIFFNMIDIGAGEPIRSESALERLQEVEPNSNVYANVVVPANVPLPGAHLFMVTGMLLLAGGRRLNMKA